MRKLIRCSSYLMSPHNAESQEAAPYFSGCKHRQQVQWDKAELMDQLRLPLKCSDHQQTLTWQTQRTALDEMVLPAGTPSRTSSWGWRCAAVRRPDSAHCSASLQRLCCSPACIGPPTCLHTQIRWKHTHMLLLKLTLSRLNLPQQDEHILIPQLLY